MDFQSLYKKIKTLDEDTSIAECGGEERPTQPSSVTMNVNMSGTGADGIRDLMDILRNLEDGSEEADAVISIPGADLDAGEEEIIDDSFDNSADRTHTTKVDAVIPKGNDMNSKGGHEPRKPAGGGNPYNTVNESLKTKLSDHYNRVKTR